jgi:ATP-dependent Lhr-like helicase
MSAPCLAPFHPLVRRWFAERFGAPTDAQAKAWPLIAAGDHVLLSAPTGSGKTLAAFLWTIDSLVAGRWPRGGLQALYLSPLKALNRDVRLNLLAPLDELRALFAREGAPFPPLRVQTRSGDTPDDERRALLRHPPDILITTPESLNLMLTGKQSRQLFDGVRTVILDEIHALAASKRGTYMMTAVERLTLSAGEFQRIALSATVRPAEAVAAWMAGHRLDYRGETASFTPRPVRVVHAADPRAVALTLRTPAVDIAPGPDAADLRWQALTDDLRAIVLRNRATLIFANSRRTVEKLARLLNAGAPEPLVYAHHGSLAREIRLDVEERMKQGRLRGVVATGSLELGIDIGSVDEVVLVGAPPSVAQSVQRIGRADHRVGGTSRASLFPLHGLDGAAAASLAEQIGHGAVEELRPIANPLDVLAQILLSLGCHATWDLDRLYDFVRTVAAYHTLPRRHFDLVIAMLAGRYADTPVRELKARALIDRGRNRFTSRPGTDFVLYQSGGTIPDRGYYHLRLADTKAVIGELDEEFVWERRLGDQFSLGTQAWRILDVTHNDVLVGPADPHGPMIPFWKAEEQNRSTAASFALLDFFDFCQARGERDDLPDELGRRFGMDEASAKSLARFLARQRETARAPLPGRLRVLVEVTLDQASLQSSASPAAGDLQQVILHTFWGGRVNRPLAIALGEAWRRRHGSPLEVFASNDQIMLMLPEGLAPDGVFALVPASALGDLLRAGLEGTALFGARFRENSGRALLLPRGGARRRLPLWLNRLRSQKLLGGILRYPDFPILVETWRELLEDEFDLPALAGLLDDVASQRIALHVTRPARPTPFADGIVYRQTNEHMYRDDAPGGDTRSALAEDLFKDLFHDAASPPAVPAALVADFAAKLDRTAPGYEPTTPTEILLAARESPFVSLASVETWRARLPPAERAAPSPADDPLAPLVVYRLPGATADLVADRADLPRVLALLDLRANQLPMLRPLAGGARESLLSFLDEHAARAEVGSAATLLGEALRDRPPLTLAELGGIVGLGTDALPPLLDELLETGAIVAGVLVDGAGARQFCDRENFERLLRLARAGRRVHAERSLAPRPLATLPHFLAAWQGLGRQRGGLEALQGALDRLFGFPLPADLWEGAVLPSRLAAYQSSWLDTLIQSYGLGWLGCGEERITFALGADLELFRERPGPAPAADTLTPAVRARLREGALGFFDLATSLGLDTATLARALWDMVWRGVVVTDNFETVRRGLLTGFAAEPLRPERSGHAGFRRWERSRPSAGLWRLLADEGERDAVERAEIEKERARAVLARYGVVSRALLEHELPRLRWPRLFRSLRLLELSGEIVSGHFFAGLPGLQFAVPAALQRLGEPLPEQTYVVNACDPASLCGLGLEGLEPALPRRLPGNWLVYCGSRLVLVLQRGGRDLTVHLPAGDARLGPALDVYRLLLERPSPPSTLTVETIDGGAASASPHAEALRRAGFGNDYRGLSRQRG